MTPVSIGQITIHLFHLTGLPQLFVPPLIRERITNPCDETYSILNTIPTPFVPHESPNECLLRQSAQAGPKPLVLLFIPASSFRFLNVIRSINHDSILHEQFVWIGYANPSLSIYLNMKEIPGHESFLEKNNKRILARDGLQPPSGISET
jgi:hypothetical protein